MLVFPNNANAAWQNNLPATPANSAYTAVTASATINTKGSYAELIAATTYGSYGFFLGLTNSAAAATDTSMLLDIAIGAAASEVDILSNYLAGLKPTTPATGGPEWTFIPLFIPAGARVSARIQGVIASDILQVAVSLIGGRSQVSDKIFTACDTYGANTADSGGTSHTPGNTGAESTPATIGTASRDYGAVLLSLGNTLTVASNLAYHWELVASATTLAEWLSHTTTAENILGPYPSQPALVRISNGTAMQIQAECSATAEAQDVALHCFY